MENSGSILRTQVSGPQLWTGGKFGPEAGLVVLVTLTLFSLLVWYALRPRLLPRAPVAAEADAAPSPA